MSDKDHHRKRKAEREALREELLEAQFELRTLQHGSVLLLISGNDFAGKAEIIHSFYEWLDNRYLNTRAFALPKGVERRMPRLWRYWRTLPPTGELGFYLISDGSPKPYRFRVRPPSFINLTILEDMCLGQTIADAVIILGSVDIVLGEVDR